jgi:hypothetical protein
VYILEKRSAAELKNKQVEIIRVIKWKVVDWAFF